MTGIICVNKPESITSFGVCAKVRGITKEKKCGHAGTLDPMATGVLPVLIGGATRFLDFLPESDKGYVAEFQLGVVTDTLDSTGTVLEENPVDASAAEVAEVCGRFKGRIMQIPPMYSAVSVNGKRLYELARQGVEIERNAREIEIKSLDIRPLGGNVYELKVLCSKGTYIRSLISDIGKALGCGAVMTALRRTYACGFSINDCISLTELQSAAGSDFNGIIIPIDSALGQYPSVTVSAPQSIRFKNGGSLDINRIKQNLNTGNLYRMYSPQNEFLGLGEATDAELLVKRVFINK